MYDAIDDPYTYENSAVLVNKLGLRDQAELDDFVKRKFQRLAVSNDKAQSPEAGMR